MLVDQEVMDALKAIGLNLYERKLWVALLSRGVSTAGELAEISGVPRSRAYDVLESLAEKGFVLIKPSKPMHYVAIEPSDAFERAKAKLLETANQMASKIDRIKNSEIGKKLKAIYKEGIELVNPEEMMSAIKGRHIMHKQIASMLKRARKSVKIMAPKATVKEISSVHRARLKKLHSKGVKVHILTDASPEDESIKELSDMFHVRTLKGIEDAENLTSGFVMVDDKQALVEASSAKTHPSQHASVWLNSEHISRNVLSPAFSQLWEKAKPV